MFNNRILRFIISAFIVLYYHPTSGQSDAVFLKAGDIAPDIKVHKWIKGNPINENIKGKLLVIEFGATWCKPCAAAIPHLTALQNKYRGRVEVISLFVQELITAGDDRKNNYIRRVEAYVQKKGEKINYTVGVDDENGTLEKMWLKASGREGIPQIFVIGVDGRIYWIGSNPQVLDSVVSLSMKDGLKPPVSNHVGEVNYDLPASIKSDDTDTILFSALSKFRPGQEDGSKMPFNIVSYPHQYPKDSAYVKRTGSIEIVGAGLRRLYYLAYADTVSNYAMARNSVTNKFQDTIMYPNRRSSYARFWYKPVLEMKDSSIFNTITGLPDNRFNYIIKAKKGLATAEFFQKKLQDDLKCLFGYEVTVETRLMPCWVLTATEEARKSLPTKSPGKPYQHYKGRFGTYHFRNAEIRDIIFNLESKYGYGFLRLIEQPNKQPPFIDETGIKGEIDFVCDAELSEKIIQDVTDENSFPWYQELLSLIGIKMEKTLRPMKVVVIREALNSSVSAH